MITARVSTSNCGFPPFGTRSVQLSERKNGLLTPKRHQIKHLEFVISWFGTRGSEVQILSPRPTYLDSDNYMHMRCDSDLHSNGFRSRSHKHMLFILKNLVTEMIPYVKTKGSRVRMFGYPAESECLRHFTMRSKPSIVLTPKKASSQESGNRKYLSSC